MKYIRYVFIILFVVISLYSCSDRFRFEQKLLFYPSENRQDHISELVTYFQAQGYSQDMYKIKDDIIYLNDFTLIKKINNFNAYFNTSENSFYYILSIMVNGEMITVLTIDPYQFKKDFDWKDDIIEIHSRDRLDLIDFDLIDLDELENVSYYGFSKKEFKSKLLDKKGFLLSDDNPLFEDYGYRKRISNLIYYAISIGMIVFKSDYDGRIIFK